MCNFPDCIWHSEVIIIYIYIFCIYAFWCNYLVTSKCHYLFGKFLPIRRLSTHSASFCLPVLAIVNKTFCTGMLIIRRWWTSNVSLFLTSHSGSSCAYSSKMVTSQWLKLKLCGKKLLNYMVSINLKKNFPFGSSKLTT